MKTEVEGHEVKEHAYVGGTCLCRRKQGLSLFGVSEAGVSMKWRNMLM